MLKKQVAALILALGLLGGCAPTTQGETTDKTQTQGSAIQGDSDAVEMTKLSDYAKKGTSIADAAEAGSFDGVALPVAVGDTYAAVGADSTPVTDALYDRVKVLATTEKRIWVFYRGKRFICLSTKGDLLMEGKGGKVSLVDDTYLVWEKASGVSEIFALNGTKLTRVEGTVTSATGGVLVSQSGKHWYLTDTETWVTKKLSQMKTVTSFYKGYASAQTTDGTWGILNSDGELTALADVSWMDAVCGGYILAQDSDGQYGVLTTGGEEAVSFAYAKANACGEETPIYQLWMEDGTCTVRNVRTDQSIRLPHKFDGEELTAWPHNYFSFTEPDGTIVLFDDLGTMELSAGTELKEWDEDTLVACDGATTALVHLDQGTMAKQQDGVFVKNNGISRGQTDYLTTSDPSTGLQGIWDTDGDAVLDAEYDWIRPVGNGLFAAKKNGGCGLVDTKGRWTVYMEDK